MIKVKRYRFEIQFCGMIIGLFLFLLGLLGFLIVFFDVGFEMKIFLYFFVSISILLFLDFIFCFIAIKTTNNKYYIISGDGIKYYSKNRELNYISKKEITSIYYISKWYFFFFQLGFGGIKIQVENHEHNPIEKESYAYADLYDRNENIGYISIFTTKKKRERIFLLLK